MDLSNKNLSIKRATKHVHKPGYKFPVEKRIEVVTKWLALGNMRLVSELTGVSYQLCRMWKGQPWWDELVAEVKASRVIQTDNKLSRIVDKSLDTIADRLENGDVVFNQKTGEVVRKEVSLKDATKVATDLLTRQAVLHKQEQEQTQVQQSISIQDQLKMLADEFAKFNKRNTGPVEDAVLLGESDAVHAERETGLQEGSEGIHESSFSGEEEDGTECSSSGDDEGWDSEEGGWEGRGSYSSSEQGWEPDSSEEPESSTSIPESLIQP